MDIFKIDKECGWLEFENGALFASVECDWVGFVIQDFSEKETKQLFEAMKEYYETM